MLPPFRSVPVTRYCICGWPLLGIIIVAHNSQVSFQQVFSISTVLHALSVFVMIICIAFALVIVNMGYIGICFPSPQMPRLPLGNRTLMMATSTSWLPCHWCPSDLFSYSFSSFVVIVVGPVVYTLISPYMDVLCVFLHATPTPFGGLLFPHAWCWGAINTIILRHNFILFLVQMIISSPP